MKAYIRVIKNKTSRYSFYIYARACILNQTECFLKFYYSSTIGGQLISGQTNEGPDVLMISNRANIRVGIDPRNISRQLSIRILLFFSLL